MNKTELVAAVAEKTGLTKKDAEKALCALIETVKEGNSGSYCSGFQSWQSFQRHG